MPKPVRYEHGWKVNFWQNGVKVRKSGFKTKFAAQQYINSVISGEDPESRSKNTILESIGEYNRWSEQIKHKSASTMYHQRYILRIFSDWAKSVGLRETHAISKEHMRLFQQYYFDNAPFYAKPNYRLKSDHRSTWNVYAGTISTFINWCIERAYLDDNPLKRTEFKLKISRQPVRVIREEELKKIFEYLDNFDRASAVPYGTFFRTLLYTGMRRDELIYLKWDDTSFKDRKIKIVKTKTGKPRTIPISSKLLPILDALPTKQNTYVFDGGDNSPIYASGRYWKVLQKVTDAVGIRHIRLHDFRHTFGAHLAMENVPLGIIQKLLGHSNIQQTMVYVDFYPERFQESIEKLNFQI